MAHPLDDKLVLRGRAFYHGSQKEQFDGLVGALYEWIDPFKPPEDVSPRRFMLSFWDAEREEVGHLYWMVEESFTMLDSSEGVLTHA